MAGSRETVQHAVCDRAASIKALLDADFTVLDTAELLALVSEREKQARADAAVDHRILAALMDRATPHEIGRAPRRAGPRPRTPTRPQR